MYSQPLLRHRLGILTSRILTPSKNSTNGPSRKQERRHRQMLQKGQQETDKQERSRCRNPGN